MQSNYEQDTDEKNPLRAIKDCIIDYPLTKIIFWGVVAVGAVYLFGLTSRVIAGAVKSFSELQDALKKK